MIMARHGLRLKGRERSMGTHVTLSSKPDRAITIIRP